MDAIILAGGIPLPGEPLYSFTKGRHKALIKINGKPMIQWILDALSESHSIDKVVIVGLEQDADIHGCKELVLVPNQSDIIENIRAGAKKLEEISQDAGHVLVLSSDIPAISGDMVDWVTDSANDKSNDIFYNIVPRETMEKRFPGSHRTYIHFKDLVFCSGDMHVVNRHLLTKDDSEIWVKIAAARKRPLKQAALIGFDTVILYLLRQLTLKKAESKVSQQLNVMGCVVVCPFAEIGMDVDKPEHLEIVTRSLI